MRKMISLAAAFLFCSVPAYAADQVMKGFYGNTLVVTGDAFQSHVHYRADHTLDTSGTASGQAFSTKGTWKIEKKGQVCRTYEKTVPTMSNPFCNVVTAHKVGDTWTTTGSTGSARNITLVAGVQ